MATTLRSVAVGAVVKLRTDDHLDDYIVVHQGTKPSNDYDDSCSGTWLLKKEISTLIQWHSSERNDYANSDIRNKLENELFKRFSPGLQSAAKLIKLPYCAGTGSDANYQQGANGLPSKFFLLSSDEVGCVSSGVGSSPVGTELDYFIVRDDGDDTLVQPLRVAYHNGIASTWWLRDPFFRAGTSAIFGVWVCTETGRTTTKNCQTNNFGLRPAIVFPQDLTVLDSGEVVANQPPSTPSLINVPEFVKGGGTLSISWGAATDPDGNLAGYRLERSINGGGFTQIFDGNALGFTDNITYGWNTVAYRVRAYDSAGEVSGYATSPTRNIFNNSAPTAPPAIHIPDEVKGGKGFAVSWDAATDVDGNLAGYQLERSINGGGFAQVYLGAARSFNDTVAKGTGTVAYRVRAYDSENAWSGYTTSATRTVINNTPPSISGVDGNLGTKNNPFSVAYSVSDPDGDAITVTEKLDNQVIRSFTAEAGKEYQVSFNADTFRQILNGAHTITVTATDAPGESVTRTWTWSKNVTHISVTMKTPKESAGRPYKCLLNINAAIPTGAVMTAEICNNGFDAQPTWEECTAAALGGQVIFIANTVKTAGKWGLNFRVRVDRGGASGDCYITGISGNFEEEGSA